MITQRILLLACAFALTGFAEVKGIAVMETALGNKAQVASLRLAKEAGYTGIQLHTGKPDLKGQLPLALPGVIAEFKAARAAEGVEIVSLCAGEMNRYPSWDPETRRIALDIGLQSLDACVALDVPILLIPFFGKASFPNVLDDPKLIAAADLMRELADHAEKKGVILGLESPNLKEAVDQVRSLVNSPNLKVYYDTGNMLDNGEDIYTVIPDWGAENICEIHLKPFNADGVIFGKGETDLPRLAASIREAGYKGWLVFEAGRGKKTLGLDYAKTNREGIRALGFE